MELAQKLDGFSNRLDEHGKPAWIAVMILGFIIFWPVGLGILGYMIWSGRMGCSKHKRRGKWMRGFESGYNHKSPPWARPTSGNRAFDEYRADTLKRLESEFDEFQDFLEQLRMAKDKEQFDKFMKSRSKTVDGDAKDDRPAS